jgi:hypothetical protein
MCILLKAWISAERKDSQDFPSCSTGELSMNLDRSEKSLAINIHIFLRHAANQDFWNASNCCFVGAMHAACLAH